MLNKEWIISLVSDAHKSSHNLNDTVIEHITQLLYSDLTNEVLTPSELKNISISLLKDIGINSPEIGGKK